MLKSLIKIAMMLVVTSNILLGQFSGGAGTEASPYLIKTKADLMNIRDSFAVDKHYKLCNNIRDSLREPIHYFENSTFDGQGYKITLAIKNYYGCIGLFEYIITSNLKNIVIDGYIIYDTIRNITGGMDLIYTGGIVGYADNSVIYNCVNLSNISIKSQCIGGIVGELYKSEISHCINIGKVESTNHRKYGEASPVAGIVGHSHPTGKILNCYNAGFIYGESAVGGILGILGTIQNQTVISNCFNVGTIRTFIDAETRIGGIIPPEP